VDGLKKEMGRRRLFEVSAKRATEKFFLANQSEYMTHLVDGGLSQPQPRPQKASGESGQTVETWFDAILI
jgi:hypothetical protein